MNKNTNNFKILNFNQIDQLNYVEKYNRGGWVDWGMDNMMADYYLNLMGKSALHNAILCGKSKMIGGNGWSKKDLSTEALIFLSNQFDKYDMDEILARISYDEELYGAFALGIIWSKDRTKIKQIYYVDPSKLRIAVPNPQYPQVEEYYMCDNWREHRKNEVIKYPGFSFTDRKEANQILYVKSFRPGKEFYGEPEYISGVNWISLEWEISQFHLSNVKNGFAPSMIISYVNGIPSDEEMAVEMRRMKAQYQGARQTGEVIFTYAENKDQVPIITPIETNSNDGKFIELTDNMRQGIINAHQVNDPAIFGINNDSGVIINQSRNLNSIEEFQSLYITPKQNMIEKVFNRLARINNIQDKLKIEEYKIKYSKMDLSTSDILTILTSTVSRDQKINILSNAGFTNEESEKLVGPEQTIGQIEKNNLQ